MARVLPDSMKVAGEVLAQCGAPVGHNVPKDLPGLLAVSPRFTAYRAGGVADESLLLDRANIYVIAWALAYEDARDLAETGRTLLQRAWRAGWSGTNGRITLWRELIAPNEVELANQPDGVHRFDAMYRINTRPPP